MTLSLQGRVAIVTGAAGGIGAATSRLLAARGARVVAADVDAAGTARLVEAITAEGGAAHGVTLDLASEASITAMFAEVMARFGRLDILDNNAALLSTLMGQRDRDIRNMDTEVWDATFAVNARGAMICCREALRIMEGQRSGVIINITSNLALQGNVIQAAYSASKAAVIQMTRSIATSHGRLGIRCNAVLPGLTGTPRVLGDLPAEMRRIVEEETLVPFLGSPEDIAELVAFLASDAARNITGQAIASDGGTSIHVPGYARFTEFFPSPWGSDP